MCGIAVVALVAVALAVVVVVVRVTIVFEAVAVGAVAVASLVFVVALVDNAVALAVSSGGSRVLEACYRETNNKNKKKIVELCSKREKDIVATRHGVVLFKRLGVKQFQNNANGWEKREEKSAAIRAEFEKEFGFRDDAKEVVEVPPPRWVSGVGSRSDRTSTNP